MQIRTTVGYQLTPVGLAITGEEEEGEEVGGRGGKSVAEDVENMGSSHADGGNINGGGGSHYGKRYRNSSKN